MTYLAALEAVCGKTRVESEDERWAELLAATALLQVRGDEQWWQAECESLALNNTGNLLELLDKTKHRVRQVLVRRGKHLPAVKGHVEQCCVSLHLTTLLVHVFVRTLSDYQMDQLFDCSTSDGPLQLLLEELAELLRVAALSDSTIEQSLHDVLFFAVTFLMAMLSSQVYDSFAPLSNPLGPMHSQPKQKMGPSHAMLRCLFRMSEEQMHRALTFSTSSGCGVSSRPSFPTRESSAGGLQLPKSLDPRETLPCHLVKGLLKLISPESINSMAHTDNNTSVGTKTSAKLMVHPIGIHESSLTNFNNRMISSHGKKCLSSDVHSIDEISPTSSWSPFGFLRLPYQLLQHLHIISDSGVGSTDDVILLPEYMYCPDTRDITIHDTTSVVIPAHSTSMPLSLKAMHAITAPLVERSAALLNILLQNRRGGDTLPATGVNTRNGRTYVNPFQQALALFHDAHLEDNLDVGTAADQDQDEEGSWDLETGGGSRAARGQVDSSTTNEGIHLSFPTLCTSLIPRLTLGSPTSLLLTYTLLHTHNTFLSVLVSSGNVKSLLVALLKTLYVVVNTVSSACKEYAKNADRINSRPSTVPALESIYLVVINILLIVQDVKLRPLLSKLTTRDEDLAWYKEKALGEISLGDLTILCTLRAAMTTLQHLHDHYLLTNLMAIVLDLSAFVQHISPYCAERVVVLTFRLCRKYNKQMSEGVAPYAQDMGECLKVLLVLIATTVRDTGKQMSNINMLYTLARKHAEISALDSFANRHVVNLFTPAMEASTEGTLVLQNGTNSSATATAPTQSSYGATTPLPMPLSRTNSTNMVPSLSRNCSSPATFDVPTATHMYTNATTTPPLSTNSAQVTCNSDGNSIPPNIHIIRVTQQGLHMLQQGSTTSSEDVGSLVDSEADIVPRSAVQALALLATQLEHHKQPHNALTTPSGTDTSTSGSISSAHTTTTTTTTIHSDNYDIVPMDFGRFVMYAYEEGPSPAEFFVPFAWEAAVSVVSELAWRVSDIELFDSDPM